MLLVAPALLASCDGGSPSTLEPAGPGARRVEELWWLIFWIAGAVFIIVVAFLVVAIIRGKRQDVRVSRETRWGEPLIVIGGVIAPSAILITVLTLSLADIQELSGGDEEARLEIEVVAHDWWWEARYPNGGVTANEIHIPVGEPVRLRLETADVIHSFWVPRLQPKMDMVTGRVHHTWLQADEPGRYRGQCAEYCGLQHANMAFYVVAEPPDRFDVWLEGIAEPSVAPTGSAARGQEVFMSSTCVGCHAIKGTPADSQIGPDLTHLGQRRTLLAGTVANTSENLATIITDPQQLKPGMAMPPTQLSPAQLSDLVAYLEQLE